MKVRTADMSDLAAVIAINRESNPHPWAEHHFESAICSKQVYVLEQAQQVIAFAIWQAVCDEAELHLLVTCRRHLRQGAAGALLEDFIRTHTPQIRRFLLEVRAGNHAARALYTQHGFVEIARRENYYLLPLEDAVIMEKGV